MWVAEAVVPWDLPPAALNKAAERREVRRRRSRHWRSCSRPRIEKRVNARGEIIGASKLWDNKKRGMVENSTNYIGKPGTVRDSEYYVVQKERSG